MPPLPLPLKSSPDSLLTRLLSRFHHSDYGSPNIFYEKKLMISIRYENDSSLVCLKLSSTSSKSTLSSSGLSIAFHNSLSNFFKSAFLTVKKFLFPPPPSLPS